MATPFPFVASTVLTAAQLNAITELPSSTKTASYVLVAGDAGTRVVMNVASANTVTVNNSLFSAGQIVQISNIGAGVTTVTAGAGVTINSADVLTLAQYQGGALVFSSASAAVWFPTAKTVSSGVVQVKSTAKTNTFTTSSATFVDVTGLTVSITPTSASNKVLIVAQIAHGIGNGDSWGHFKINGGNSSTYVGDSASNRIRAVFGGFFAINGENFLGSGSIVYLDSPATTSATTYAVQCRAGATGSARVNVALSDSDNASVTRGASSITVFEVTP